MALTEGQDRNQRARAARTKFLNEYERLTAVDIKPNIPAMAKKYNRTTQCLYLWLKWGVAQKAKAKAKLEAA